jgi:acetolactate synthase I/II/III large subunit
VKVVDAIARILKIEGAEFLSAYPTTPVIDAAARVEIRPVLCRQERVGVGIADGYARVKNGKTLAAFCMQYGPGAENAFPGVATAYSDSTPMLLLPLGHPRDRAQVFPLFSSARTYASVTKSVETVAVGSQIPDVMRRAISVMRMGRPGPAMVEIPADILNEDVPEALIEAYQPVKVTSAGANTRDVEAAARVLCAARRPVIHAGQGVLYAEASDDLLELAELLEAPVMTTMEAKSAFPEDHALALGTGLGLIIGAKLAAPDKFCVNFMGDAAFGMTGLDFETVVRCGIPILTVVLNNSAMAIEIPHLVVSHDKYGTRDIGGRYADLGRAMGGWSERVESPDDIAGAFARARKATESGQAALLEFVTSQETRFSHRGALR